MNPLNYSIMKRSRLLIIVLAAVIFFPIAGHLLWIMQKKIPMNLLIVNKSVPNATHNEVKSLNWVLNYGKVLSSDNRHYDYTKDYYGFHPEAANSQRAIRSFSINDVDYLQNQYDGLIYLDNAGVELDQNEFSNLSHYGGINQVEYLLLHEMFRLDKLVIAEYNFFSRPTEDLICFNIEQLLDIYSLKWKGKFFNDLNYMNIRKELSPEWFDIFKENQGQNWNFSGSGLVFINETQNRIIVLPSDQYMDKQYPEVISEGQLANSMNLPEAAAFDGWFEYAYEGGNEVISYLRLNLNDKGKAVMMSNGLDDKFPIAIKVTDRPFYYFSGDFSKQKVFMGWSRIKIANDLCRLICRSMTKNPARFFQTWYVPAFSSILENYYEDYELKNAS